MYRRQNPFDPPAGEGAPPQWLLETLNRKVDLEKNHERQIRDAKAALQMLPDVPQNHNPRMKLRNDLAMLLWTAGDMEKATTWCLAAIQAAIAAKDPAELLALLHVLLGNLYRSSGDWKEGLEAFETALQFQPGDWRAIAGIGWIHDLEGRHLMAIACFQRVASAPDGEPGDRCLAWSHLGDLYARRGDDAKALECLLQARQVSDEEHACDGDLGTYYMGLGRYEEAETYMLSALKANPTHHAALSNLGFLYWMLRRPDEAKKILARRLETRSWDATSALLTYGCLEYEEKGKLHYKAEKLLRQVLTVHATNAARNHTHPLMHDATRALALIALDHALAPLEWQAILAARELPDVGRLRLWYLQCFLERLAACASPPPMAAQAAEDAKRAVAEWKPREV